MLVVLGLERGRLLDYLPTVLKFFSNNRRPIVVLDHEVDKLCPPEAKKTAERIARMRDYDFIIATCNPYVLTSLILKSSASQLTVLIAKDDGSGNVEFRRLTTTQIEEILDLEVDVFFNIDKFFEEAPPLV